jgi:hypothetical protein
MKASAAALARSMLGLSVGSSMLPLVSMARMIDTLPRLPCCASSGLAPVTVTCFPSMVASNASGPSDCPLHAGPDMAMVTPSFPGVGSLSRKSTFSRGFS